MENDSADKRKCEILAEEIRGMNCGDTITHAQVSGIIGERYGSPKYGQIIAQAKKILLEEYRTHLESIRGVGYRKTEPDDFTKHALSQYKKGFRSIQRGADILTNAPVEEMSEAGRMTYRHIYDRTAQLEASVKGAVVEIKTLREKQHPFLPAYAERR